MNKKQLRKRIVLSVAILFVVAFGIVWRPRYWQHYTKWDHDKCCWQTNGWGLTWGMQPVDSSPWTNPLGFQLLVNGSLWNDWDNDGTIDVEYWIVEASLAWGSGAIHIPVEIDLVKPRQP